MSIKTQVKLKFISVDFPVVNFNSDKPYTGDQQITVDIEPSVFFPQDEPEHFRIIQKVEVSVQDIFTIFVIAIGSFKLENIEENETIRQQFINMNAPAIMFPYIRSFISTLTANVGNVTGTLNIPPQIFKGKLPIITEENL